jgi:hypothetical protein
MVVSLRAMSNLNFTNINRVNLSTDLPEGRWCFSGEQKQVH